jgi:DMSO/TMAO reductase YedYZ molybdopterin-dependent catalytic subunit
VFRSRAERKVAAAGYDPARLPPGQYLTEKWPVLHAGDVPETDLATWDFRVFGEVENPIALTWEQLQELPSSEITIDIHCVTRWSRFETSFRGVHWPDLAELVVPKQTARFVVAHAEQGFTSNVPLEALEDEQAMVAYEAEGEPLEPEHGWPLRLVVPSRYFWKSAKWLRGASSSSTTTSPASGSGTATTTRRITGKSSAIRFSAAPSGARLQPGSGEQSSTRNATASDLRRRANATTMRALAGCCGGEKRISLKPSTSG